MVDPRVVDAIAYVLLEQIQAAFCGNSAAELILWPFFKVRSAVVHL